MGRPYGSLIAFTAFLLACGGCGTQTAGPTGSAHYQLIQAGHQQCQQEGASVAGYLDNGQPTSLDPAYGSARQTVLSLTGDKRDLYIRQVADAAIQRCDQQLSQQEQQQAEQQRHADDQARQAAAQQAADQAKAQQEADYKAACEKLGGRPSFGGFAPSCHISYPVNGGGSGSFSIPLKSDGHGEFDEVDAARNQKFCSDWKRDYGGADYWHPDTRVCAIP